MSAENETIEDIEKKLRELARAIKHTLQMPQAVYERHGSMENKPLDVYLAEIADRIRAAAKRERAFHAMTEEANERLREHLAIALKGGVGNAAKMREALKAIDFVVWNKRRHTKEEVEAHRLATEALTVPPRQCDVGTVEEQDERFRNFCAKYIGGTCTGCKLQDCGLAECSLQWAQMPYGKGGAK